MAQLSLIDDCLRTIIADLGVSAFIHDLTLIAWNYWISSIERRIVWNKRQNGKLEFKSISNKSLQTERRDTVSQQGQKCHKLIQNTNYN